jgi:hypothetical protein
MLEADVDPPDKLDLVVRTLRDLGDKELTRELSRGLARATERLKADAKANAGRRLPQRGGLAARVAGAKLSTRRKSGRNPGVSIQARGMDQLGMMDSGQVKHPVFGNRGAWVVQSIRPGWFSEPMEEGRDEVAAAIGEVLDDVATRLARKLDSGL